MPNRPLTIGRDTAASHPAKARVNPFRFVWFYPGRPILYAVWLVGIGYLTFQVSLWFLPLFLPIVFLAIRYCIYVKEFFAHGDANPGLVVQVEPLRIAVATDLAWGRGCYPAVKIIPSRLRRIMGERPRVGTRLPTVALYYRSSDRQCPHWADFDPRPLECATGDRDSMSRIMNAYTEEAWERLEACVRELPNLEPKLHLLKSWPAPASGGWRMLPLDAFWELIERTTHAESQAQQNDRLREELVQLPLTDLLGFMRRFVELHRAVYHWDLWLVVWLFQGGLCSDDAFVDFRNWLISRGRGPYEMALSNPESLLDLLLVHPRPFFESFEWGSRVYQERTGRSDVDLGTPTPVDPKGGDWLRPELKDRTGAKLLNRCVVFREMGPAEFSAIERLFPRLWAHCQAKQRLSESHSTEERMLTPEEVAHSKVDPALAEKDYQAYLRALAEVAREAYRQQGRDRSS